MYANHICGFYTDVIIVDQVVNADDIYRTAQIRSTSHITCFYFVETAILLFILFSVGLVNLGRLDSPKSEMSCV